MKITSTTATIVGIKGPGGSGPSRNWIFVRVETDDGITGLGEATTEWHEFAVQQMVERHMAPLLIGQDPTRITHIWQQLYRGFHFRGGVVATSAISGIEQALWDITGKAMGQPVYKLLGGAVRDRVRLYARGDLGLSSEEAELDAAIAEGYTAFKTGPGDSVEPFDETRQVDAAIACFEGLRHKAGPEMDLMIDCAHVFSLQAASRLASALLPLRPLFIEEPVNAEVPDGLIALRHSFPNLRVAGGEVVVTRWGFREWLERGAVDVIQADVCHCGGIGELLRIAAAAEVYGIQMAPHNPYGPVAMAANLHACAAMPNFLILEHCRLRPWFEDAQLAGPVIMNGFIELSERPGLGVELDWRYIEKLAFTPIPTRLRFDAEGGLIGQ